MLGALGRSLPSSNASFCFFVVFDTYFEGFNSYLPRCGGLAAGRDLHCSRLGASRLSQLLPFRLSHILGHLLNLCKIVLRFDYHEGMMVASPLLSCPRLLPSENSRHSWVYGFAIQNLGNRILPYWQKGGIPLSFIFLLIQLF